MPSYFWLGLIMNVSQVQLHFCCGANEKISASLANASAATLKRVETCADVTTDKMFYSMF